MICVRESICLCVCLCMSRSMIVSVGLECVSVCLFVCLLACPSVRLCRCDSVQRQNPLLRVRRVEVEWNEVQAIVRGGVQQNVCRLESSSFLSLSLGFG